MPDNQSLVDQALKFISEHRSAILATVGQQGEPHASYAPFLFYENHFYIFVSELAGHTRNLIQEPKCHLMLLRAEQDSPNLFARQRLSFACQATIVDRQEELFAQALQAMRERFGPVMATLESLPDFILFQLSPGDGNFVQGFGRAAKVQLLN